MSPRIGGRCRFIINLKNVPGATIVAGLMRSSATERLSQRRRAMTSDTMALEPYGPGSVEVLADQDAPAGVAAAARSGREIDDQAA